MPQIAAFRGLRYDLGHVGSLEGVVAPPCDRIDQQLQSELYKQHPANVVRLILNRDEPGDNEDAKFLRSVQFFRNWQREGVLQREPDPAIYVYHQVFQHDGLSFTRRSFICRTRLERLGEGAIFPQEAGQPSQSEDRLKLIQTCAANLSPILGVFPDPASEVQEILETVIQGVAPVEAKDQLGVVHRLWPVSDINVINQVSSAMAGKPTFLAAGQQCYETACDYRDELGGDDLDASHGANFVMMMCSGIGDRGLLVLPTHRLFRNFPAMDSDELKSKLSEFFEVRVAGEGSDLAEMIWDQIEIEDHQGTLGLYCHADERWVVAKINAVGEQKMAEIASSQSEEWRSLGVSILHRLVVETVLGHSEITPPHFVNRVDDVVQAIDKGDVEQEGQPYQLAVLVMPASLDHLQAISELGESLPAQSTYFYPEVLSGLVFNPHES